MKEVTLNNKEQKRLLVMNEVMAGRLTGQEAADMLGLSLRHTRRLLASYRRAIGDFTAERQRRFRDRASMRKPRRWAPRQGVGA